MSKRQRHESGANLEDAPDFDKHVSLKLDEGNHHLDLDDLEFTRRLRWS